MHSLPADLKLAARRLLKSPLFAVVAILTLALGIGLNATIFTFVDAVLLRPLPVPEPEQLVAVYSSWPEEVHATSSRADWLDLRQADASTTSLFGSSLMIASLEQNGRGEMVIGELATGNFFQVLGLRPRHGRLLTMDDDAVGAGRVVVVSSRFFEKRLAGDPTRIGSTISLNGEAYEVIGVAPADFTGMMPGGSIELWAPSVHFTELNPVSQTHGDRREAELPLLERRAYRWMWLKARLAPEDSIEQMETRLGAAMTAIASAHPMSHEDVGVRVLRGSTVRIHPDIDGVMAAAAWAITGLVGLVLLVACANLASMLLARSMGRKREVAVRLALGGSRLQVVRLFVIEVLIVAVLGGTLAVALAHVASQALLASPPPIGYSFDLAVGVDSRVVLFTCAISVLAALIAAALPAFQASRPELVPALKDGVGGNIGGASRLRGGLVVAQVAVSAVLLVASALVLRGLSAAEATDIGLDSERVATIALNMAMHGYDDESGAEFLQRLEERVEALPNVESAAVAKRVPLSINYHNQSVLPGAAPGETREWAEQNSGIAMDVTWTDEGYLETLGVSMIAGRGLANTDIAGSPRVAVISAEAARRMWSDGQALGRRFRTGDSEGPEFEVIGISSDYTVRAVGEATRPMVHFAWRQRPRSNGYILARSRAGDAAPLIEEMRQIALEMDSSVAVYDATTLRDMAGVTLYPVRMGSILLSIFAVLGLFLSAVGLYGVVAYTARRRQREMGVRVALGATPTDTLRLLISSGMTLVLVGCAVGLGIAALAGRALSGVLYGRSPLDMIAFAGAATVLLLISLAANTIPAVRAAGRDPVAALREE